MGNLKGYRQGEMGYSLLIELIREGNNGAELRLDHPSLEYKKSYDTFCNANLEYPVCRKGRTFLVDA